MNVPQLHPRATLAIVVSGCVFVDTACGGIVSAILPLEHVRGLETLAPRIATACVVLAVVSNVSLALAGIGQSLIKALASAQTTENSIASSGGNAPGGATADHSAEGNK